MTEPDEALKYARESAYQRALEMLDGDETEASQQIDHEDATHVIEWLADTYRAGQAASAERIKALEEEVARLKTPPIPPPAPKSSRTVYLWSPAP